MNIQPITIWSGGQNMTAEQIILTLIWDNLENAAKFYYCLSTIAGIKVTEGNLDMIGTQYVQWGNSGIDPNLEAYQWAATQLNIQLL